MTESKKPRFINAKRRGFLQSAALAGGVAATAGVSAADLPQQETPVAEPASEPGGYKRSAHVERYYARARF